MPNQRSPIKAFLGGYFPRETVREFQRACAEAGYATNVDCLERLITDFITSRGEPSANGAHRSKAKVARKARARKALPPAKPIS